MCDIVCDISYLVGQTILQKYFVLLELSPINLLKNTKINNNERKLLHMAVIKEICLWNLKSAIFSNKLNTLARDLELTSLPLVMMKTKSS